MNQEAAELLLGRYRILRKIGRGTFGIVYLVEDTKLPRQLAIKQLEFEDPSPGGMASEEAIERFKREAQVMGELNHPNIVTVHDLDKEDNKYYIVMEFADKGSLKDLIAKHSIGLG